MELNPVTQGLKPYPMEELNRIKAKLKDKQIAIYDFGTGDPRIPVWQKIKETLVESVPDITNYPSISGQAELAAAHAGYLARRFGVTVDEKLAVLPSSGSKEAVFHAALSVIHRSGGKKHLIYPDPGYPVYRVSAQFAGGIPYPVKLSPQNGFLLEPWDLPKYIQKDAAAIWLNYPHNPTGAVAPLDYWQRVVEWGRATDTIILSDDCYNDIYDAALDESDEDRRPTCPLVCGSDGVVSFMSLSKRSGMTGYRSGLIAGDAKIIAGFKQARANFGVATPDFIQKAAIVAWNDDEHVAARRKIFSERIKAAVPVFQELGLMDGPPDASFYLWTRVPESFNGNDIKYCMALAEKGIVASPSQWLSEGIKGFARFALVPELDETEAALAILKDFVSGL